MGTVQQGKINKTFWYKENKILIKDSKTFVDNKYENIDDDFINVSNDNSKGSQNDIKIELCCKNATVRCNMKFVDEIRGQKFVQEVENIKRK